ncbi:hypothetical protein C8E00_10593 [Chromohalobacter marismortui]|uniref:Uncharacterized protein n=1 Tax=Chromohalobacter marismortui TaxID=42055 RepID=A0A4R7NM76_9GAMM|nr:hypothetical protein C8E00_10593 [Chromohalobacter marismortui]
MNAMPAVESRNDSQEEMQGVWPSGEEARGAANVSIDAPGGASLAGQGPREARGMNVLVEERVGAAALGSLRLLRAFVQKRDDAFAGFLYMRLQQFAGLVGIALAG